MIQGCNEIKGATHVIWWALADDVCVTTKFLNCIYKNTVLKINLTIIIHCVQATVAEGRPVDRARAWCSMINVPFYRFSPQLCEDLPLDTTDDAILINMLWDTQCYIVANKHRIQQVAQLLRAGRNARVGAAGAKARGSVQGVVPGLQDLQLHASSSWAAGWTS